MFTLKTFGWAMWLSWNVAKLMRYELSWSKTSVEISLWKRFLPPQNKDAKEIMWYCMENKETIQHLTMSHLVRVQLNSSVVAGDGGVKVFGFERDVSGIFRLVGRRLVHHLPSYYFAPLRSSLSFFILALSHFIHCHMLFLVVDQRLESTTKCNWPGLDPMVFPPRGNFKSTSICQTALSSQVCKESANLQIYSPPCLRLTISAFCKNLFCRSTAISFDRCWAAGKTTFWVWSQKVNRLNIITWKCSEQKKSFDWLLA